MSHVFISYAHTDQDFVQEHLIPWLNANGFDAWVDSEKLRAGENWIEEIDNAIKASYALIVVISPASMTSPYVTYEWAFALGCDIPVIPVKIKKEYEEYTRKEDIPELYYTYNANNRDEQPKQIGDIHPRLKVIQFEPFTGSPHTYPWKNLLDSLQAAYESTDPTILTNIRRLLKSALRDEREQALLSLVQIPSDSKVRVLLKEMLRSSFFEVWSRAALRLAQDYGDITTLEYLERVAKAENRQALEAFETILNLNPTDMVAVMVGLLKSKIPQVRMRAIEVLMAMEFVDTSPAPALAKVLRSDTNTEVRRIAARALGQIGDPSAVPALDEALCSDDDEEMREIAARALGQIGDPLAVPALAEALRSYIYGDVTNMQRIAAEALRQIGDPSAVPALIKVLHKYDDGQNLDMRSDAESVRVVAARALGKIGDPSAVPALDEALRKVTSQLKEEEHRLSFGLSLQMHMESLQEALVQALSEIGTSEAKQAILRYDDPAS